MKYKILIIDDEPDIPDFLGNNLRKEGYEVYICDNGIDALKMANEIIPHLILLDVMMPGMDGIEICLELRKSDTLQDTIIAFLSARNEDYSEVAGFEAGGDDYIAKPVKPKVLMSRIKALLRRKYEQKNEHEGAGHSITNINNLIIDRGKYIVSKNGKIYNLPRKEFELLNLLVSIPDNVFTRDEILNRVWSKNKDVDYRTVDVHVRKIREKLGCKNIKTVIGIGYKFKRY